MQCPALSHLDLNCNRIFADGAETERFAVVLAQCTSLPALSHLNLSHTINKYDTGIRVVEALVARCSLNLGDNEIGNAGAERLTECWSGPEGGLLLDSQESEEESRTNL